MEKTKTRTRPQDSIVAVIRVHDVIQTGGGYHTRKQPRKSTIGLVVEYGFAFRYKCRHSGKYIRVARSENKIIIILVYGVSRLISKIN